MANAARSKSVRGAGNNGLGIGSTKCRRRCRENGITVKLDEGVGFGAEQM